MSLDTWALVSVVGPDSTSYLQGQLTLDVAALDAAHHLPAAHCDAKGKMWSNLRLFHRGEGYAYLVRRALRDTQLPELKKYAVFSKVTLAADDDVVLLGVAGFQARAALADRFEVLPDSITPVVQQGETTLLWFAQPAERFLLVTSLAEAEALKQKLAEDAQLTDSTQWLALDIEAGIPVIEPATSAQFIPQATNLQALDAISFKKAATPGRRWWPARNTVAPISAPCTGCQARSAICLPQTTRWNYRWVNAGVAQEPFSPPCSLMMA